MKSILKINSPMMRKTAGLLSAVLLLGAATANAQPDDPGAGGDLGNETSVPVDGGLSLLVAAGIAYGGKKYHESRKARKIAE
jgi:hypothetical protein